MSTNRMIVYKSTKTDDIFFRNVAMYRWDKDLKQVYIYKEHPQVGDKVQIPMASNTKRWFTITELQPIYEATIEEAIAGFTKAQTPELFLATLGGE